MSTASPGRTLPTLKGRLYEVDAVRILTFLCVIAVHTTSHTSSGDSLGMNLVLDLLHFTRNVFFALTAFVLVYTYLRRPVPMKKFWPRRFLLVGVPYLVWSIIYVLVDYDYGSSSGILDLLGTLGLAIVTGTAWYHLYFLLVTMQVYLLLPVILWVVRKTRGGHWFVLAGALLFELAIVACYRYWPGVTAGINDYDKQLFFSYLFFILGGAIAADHAAEFLGWVRSHRPAILITTIVTAAITVGVFLLLVSGGKNPRAAATPLQPTMVLWSAAICLAFLAVGTLWADRHRAGGAQERFVDRATDRSFGIFLSHPLVIWLILLGSNNWIESALPTPWLTIVVYLMVLVGAVVLTELARRTPLSLALTGRALPKKKAAPVAPADPGTENAEPEVDAPAPR